MKKLMALVLAMIMLVSFAGCGGNNEVAEEGKAEAPEQEDEVQEETKTFYEMGNPAGTDAVEVVLESYDVSPVYALNIYEDLIPKEGYSFVVVNYSIKNVGKTDLGFFPCADGKNESICAETIVSVDYNDGYIFYVDEVELFNGKTYGRDFFVGGENEDVYLDDIKPLSPAVSYEVAICVPNEVIENTDAPLLIKFNLLNSNNEKVVVSYKIR